ncbi:hypothetical protein GSI_01153 [Ganoderma sinense ZZ0214-1]|uniref:Uncharacterized protein n=1 Tax=Ganoderma sinense ZZ0214-1 TaxID=1077348 RepID=A0A2G8SUK2_9APHY|nr:hypothetical protein GSI_01153 [Ganoderma sinense ZZ0214-1]
MPTIAAIPPELWEQIITAACTDGGFTGTSLALTNKFFNAQSLSIRFYSLSFTSIERIEAFLAFLAAQPNKCRPKIQHLYLSFVGAPNSAWHAPLNLWLNWSRERLDQAYKDHNSMEETRSQRFASAMTRLFALAGPHLRTLCILEPTQFSLPPLSTVTLPKLQELTLEGSCDFLVPEKPSDSPHAKTAATTPEGSQPPLSARFPSLERLHCVGRNWFNPKRVLAELAEHTPPSFTHLRFSGMATAGNKFPQNLAVQLGVRLESIVETHEPALALTPDADTTERLPHLRHLVIQGMEPEPRTMSGFLSERWAGMCGDFREIARKSREARGLQMVVLSTPWCRDPRWGDRLFDDWTDRLGGGCGCWVGPAEEEIEPNVSGGEDGTGIGEHEDVGDTDVTSGGPVRVP